MRLPLALALALALAADAADADADDAADGRHCTALQEASAHRQKYTAPRTKPVTLVWGAAPAGAAAALLRAVLLAAGHAARDVTLRRRAAAARLCDLLAAPQPARGPALVAVAAAWAPHERCAWGGGPLRVQGAGAAPADARLHVRLAPRAGAACARAAADWSFYADAAALRACGFLSPGSENATVYVPEGEWEREARELRRLRGAARLHLEPVPRAARAGPSLASLLGDPERSFLFLDAELWHGTAGVAPAPAPPGAAPRAVSLSVADEYAVYTQAAALRGTLAAFAPRAADLRAVLARAAAGLGLAEAACERAAAGAAGFGAWRGAAARPLERRAVVALCARDLADRRAYEYAAGLAGKRIYDSTGPIGLGIAIDELAVVDCLRPDALLEEIKNWSRSGTLTRTVGAVVPAEVASAVEAHAALLQLPLVAYDVAATPTTRGAAGRVEHLALALRRLLAACGWRRLGVVSERTRLAAALSAELLAGAAAPLVREEFVGDADDGARAIRSLRAADARVFLVNGGAAAAARVLAAARRLGLAPADGYAWIVREYDAADGATAALAPYSVSFQWRGREGGAAPGDAGGDAALRSQLDEEWKGRAWPRHAAGMVDALLTLGEGYKRLVLEHGQIWDYPHSEDKLRYFWEGVKKNNISGVIEELVYDDRGFVKPRVFIEQWRERARPRLLAEWRAGRRGAGDACPVAAPPHDGTRRCLAPAGDAFHPSCRDAAWIAGGAALAAGVAALAGAARAARRALARRDRRVKLEVAAELLARRERAFAALAPHLVDRAALELREELGAGRFGRVRLAVLRAPARARPAVVAAKALRADAAPAEESQFLREACTLAALDHEHVVRFEGVCVADGPPLLLMEHAFFGDLLRYLRARRHLALGAAEAEGEESEAEHVSAAALTRLAREAAAALAYLARRGLVHRDVRASNCLVDARRALKLADFGLARATGAADGEYACRGRALLPVLWMAPESLARGVASAASDAWAFGVLALELVTLGARPYGAAPPASVVRAVLAGGRPPLPRGASAETRALALACWRRAPGARPSAARLAAWLARRARALRPAPAADADEVECDSGIGEPLDAPFLDRR